MSVTGANSKGAIGSFASLWKGLRTAERAGTLWSVLADLLGRFRFEYAGLLLVSAFLAAVEGILHPLLIKSIFDVGVIKGDFKKFVLVTLGYLVLGLLVNTIGSAAALWSKSLENRIVQTMTRRMLESYYQKEYAGVLQNGDGYFINRIFGDVREGLVPLLTLIQGTISQSVLLLSFSFVLAYLSWQAFLFLLAVIPFSAVGGALLGRRIRAFTSKEREQEGAVLATLSRALGAFRMVRGFNLSSQTVYVFGKRFEEYLVTRYRGYRLARLFQSLNDATMVIADFLSMFVGALFVLRGVLSFGGYLAFVNTFWRAVTLLMQLFNRMSDFQRLGVIVRRIASFLSSPARVYYQTGQSVSVSNLCFSYGGAEVLKDFSLRLAPGERVLIVGPNGSGKTTLANVVSGYLAPSQGEVFLPGRISAVTLPISFPPLKVKDLVNDTDLLSKFDLGDKTVLDAFADELSVGQQQKLAISLVLSQEADLYIIDEPLACLDRESRDAAMSLIFERTRRKALIVIMHGSEEHHRLFDRVIRIDRCGGAESTSPLPANKAFPLNSEVTVNAGA